MRNPLTFLLLPLTLGLGIAHGAVIMVSLEQSAKGSSRNGQPIFFDYASDTWR